MENHYTEEEIHYMDGGIVTLGYDELRYLLSDIFTKVPAAIVDKIYENCIFLMPNPEEQGSYVTNRIIKGKDIILLPHALLSWPSEKQINIVLHEAAHYFLGHKSGIELYDRNDIEYQRQEKEADALMNKWLNP